MPISDEPNKILYYTDGTVREFSFNFKFFNTSDIHVSFWTEGEGVYLEENKDYEIDYTDKEGGSVVLLGNRGVNGYPATPHPGTLLISRVMPLDQQANIRPVSGFPEEVITNTFDKLVMIDQQQEEELQRCLKLPGNSLVSDLTLPEPLANNSLIWDEDGTKLVNYDLKGENEAFKEEIVELNQVLEGNINTQFNNFKTETNQQFSNFKTEINDNIETFKNDINTNIEEVLEASEKVNQLEQSVATATNASKVATEQATIATNKANEVIGAAANTLNKSQIANCLLEVPQNIKLELNDGVLTLKKGSKVIVPNGFEANGTTPKFDYVTVPSDATYVEPSALAATLVLYYVPASNTLLRRGPQNQSGTSVPSGFNSVYYNTSTNYCYNYINGTKGVQVAFPIAICTSNGEKTNNIISIDQVFNGFGYIGSLKWLDTGVVGLATNGRNADGSLNNIQWKRNSILLKDTGATGSSEYIDIYTTDELWYNTLSYTVSETEPTTKTQSYWWYNPSTNEHFRSDGTNWVKMNATVIGRSSKVNGPIVSFSPKPPFRAVDYNEVNQRINEVENNSLNKQQITNCLLEVPEKIKYTLFNGVLTLKAGSELVIPNGFETNGTTRKFNKVTISSDMTFTYGGNIENLVVCATVGSFYTAKIANTLSSTSEPSIPSDNARVNWFDATNNIIKSRTTGSWVSNVSFPLFILDIKGGKVVNLKSVFNGFGFIGHHTFSYEGIKALIPNGKNADGTFKNKETITTSINVRDEAGRGSWVCLWDGTNILTYGVNNYFEQDTQPTFSGQHCMWFNTKENLMYTTSDYGATWTTQPRMYLGKLRKETGAGDFVEASFKTPVELVKKGDIERNLVEVKEYVVDTSGPSLMPSWYRVYSPDQTGKKWCEQGGLSGSAATGSSINVSFLKTFSDTNYTLCLSSIGTYTKVGESNDTITSKTATGFTVVNGPAQPQQKSWFACGYIN